MKTSTIVWDKGSAMEKIVEKFTVDNDRKLDLVLAKYDVQGSMAHAQMLEKTGLIGNQECKQLLTELQAIGSTIKQGIFRIPEGFEDVHSYVEYLLTEKLGETGKKIHTGRSRNDQVLVDMHLYLKDEINEIIKQIRSLFSRLMELSDVHKNELMPGYTHMQMAMPSSFGLWFSAYAELLIDDIYLFNAAYKVADQNPLGSAAGYGSSFPLDRQMTTDLLGFETLKYNSMAAQLSRGKLEKTLAFAMASLSGTLSKFAMDVVLYMNQNFGFISFPDELTTGSSIMPHKKNPDVFELVRAKCNKIQAFPAEISMLTGNLPGGYHRDFQVLKEPLFSAINEIKSCLEVTMFMLGNIKVKKDLLEDARYDAIFSVENVNALVKKGHSFREAYRIVGEEIKDGTYRPNRELDHIHIGSIGNLCLKELMQKFEKAVNDV